MPRNYNLTHLAAELFCALTGVKMLHVHFAKHIRAELVKRDKVVKPLGITPE